MTLAPVLAAALLAAEPAPKKVAVFDLEATGVEPTLALAASLTLPTEVRARLPGAQVISSSEIQAMLGLEKQRAMMGCTDAACLAEIGGALGVDELLSGRLGRVGKTYVLEIRRTDVKKARVVGSAARTVRGDEDALLGAIQSSLDELYPGTRAGTAVREVGQPSAEAGGPSFFKTRLGAGIIGVLGLAAAGAGTYGVIHAIDVHNQYENQQSNRATATVTREQADRMKIVYPVSVAGVVVGAAALTWGAYWLISGPPPSVQAAVVPIPGGATLALGGTF